MLTWRPLGSDDRLWLHVVDAGDVAVDVLASEYLTAEWTRCNLEINRKSWTTASTKSNLAASSTNTKPDCT